MNRTIVTAKLTAGIVLLGAAGAAGCAADTGSEQTGSTSEAITGPGGCTSNAATAFEQSVAGIVIRDLFAGNTAGIPQDGQWCNSGPEQYYNNLTLAVQDIEAKLAAGTATITPVGPGWVKSYKDQTKCVSSNFYKLTVTDGSIAPGGGGAPGGYGWMTLLQNSIAHCEQYGHLGGAPSGDYGAAVYIEGYGYWMNRDGTAFTSNPAFNNVDGFIDPGPVTLSQTLASSPAGATAAAVDNTGAATTAYQWPTSCRGNSQPYGAPFGGFLGGEGSSSTALSSGVATTQTIVLGATAGCGPTQAKSL